MNVDVFKSFLRPFWNTWAVGGIPDAADKIATAYELSNIASSGPFYGAKLIKGNKEVLTTFLTLGLQLNFTVPVKTPSPFVEPGFTLMATGFCLYWLGSTFTPMPPMPPMFAPVLGTQVIFPGVPVGFDKALKETFNNTDVEPALTSFANALVAHQLTIMGVYTGLAPGFPSPIPLVLPWTSMLSIPGISPKVPKILDDTDTDGDGTPDYLDSDIDNDGIPNDQDQDKDGDGIPNTDEPGTVVGAGGAGTGTGGGTGGGAGGGGTGTGTGGGGTGTGGGGTGSGGGTGGGATGTSGGGGTGTGTGTGGGTGVGTGTSGTGASKLQQDVFDFFKKETDDVLTRNNKFGLQMDYTGTLGGQLQLVVSLHESVVEVKNQDPLSPFNDSQYQFALNFQLINLAFDKKLGGAAGIVPFTVGDFSRYTFTDTIESFRSIFYGQINSPRQRGLELMKTPYMLGLTDLINTSLAKYIDDYYPKGLPNSLKTVTVYFSDEINNPNLRSGGRVFVPLNKFKRLS